ncbi:hypothetical protein GCM10007916_13990 [Psychromonas marina]|uniref:DUF3299 domain-containing protein n=1 Tax=Psychromonas marina TaxID=88364 RepID=A0ABQ6DZ48_9GAMM|nr:DUF3299 domain-containing protein [Psychromonas marina]GLS90332.1 hypothetical protein GCM10007916_13990 [Psychromonas marina]
MKKLLLIPFLLSFFSVVQATEAIKIGWVDLQGKVAPYQDPFKDLTEDQVYNLSIYARISKLQKDYPKVVTEAMKKEAEKAKATLVREKVDITYMFEQRLIVMNKRKQAAMATNSSLMNKNIEIEGYMLALEFDGEFVKEFLLVPTIGACSHKPVPSANQLILIKVQKAIKAGVPYMPIKVSGALRITAQSKNLNLVDGQKNIDMSYSLDNATITALSGR